MKIKCKKCGWVPKKEGFIFVTGPLNQTLICIVCDNVIKTFKKYVKKRKKTKSKETK